MENFRTSKLINIKLIFELIKLYKKINDFF